MGSKPINISASRGAAILGLSDWSTPLEAWLKIMEDSSPGFCELHGYTKPVVEENASMRWGTAFEEAIIREAERESKAKIYNQEKLYRHEKYDFITCHVDGTYGEKHPVYIHEGKTTNAWTYGDKWGEPGTDKIPREYQIQVQHQMLCSEIEKAIVSVLVFPKRPDEWEKMGIKPFMEVILCSKAESMIDYEHKGNVIHLQEGEDINYSDANIYTWKWAKMLNEMGFFHQYEIQANEILQAMMLKNYKEWWERHIIHEKPPTPMNYDDIKKLCPEPKGTIVADERIERWSSEYKGITEELGRANKRKAELKTLILKHMNDNAETPIDDDSVEKWILRDSQGKKLHQYDGKIFR